MAEAVRGNTLTSILSRRGRGGMEGDLRNTLTSILSRRGRGGMEQDL
jgi:hypothetical protein